MIAPGPVTTTTRLSRVLRFVGNYAFDAPGFLAFQIRANSLYDPYVPIGGLQPAGFDQYMALYTKCYCLASRITVDFAEAQNNETLRSAQVFGITRSTSSASLGDYTTAIASGQAVWRVVGPQATVPLRLTLTCDVAKFLTRSSIVDDPDLAVTASADCTDQIFYHIWAKDLSALDTTYFNVVFTVDYHVVFTDPVSLTLS